MAVTHNTSPESEEKLRKLLRHENAKPRVKKAGKSRAGSLKHSNTQHPPRSGSALVPLVARGCAHRDIERLIALHVPNADRLGGRISVEQAILLLDNICRITVDRARGHAFLQEQGCVTATNAINVSVFLRSLRNIAANAHSLATSSASTSKDSGRSSCAEKLQTSMQRHSNRARSVALSWLDRQGETIKTNRLRIWASGLLGREATDDEIEELLHSASASTSSESAQSASTDAVKAHAIAEAISPGWWASKEHEATNQKFLGVSEAHAVVQDRFRRMGPTERRRLRQRAQHTEAKRGKRAAVRELVNTLLEPNTKEPQEAFYDKVLGCNRSDDGKFGGRDSSIVCLDGYNALARSIGEATISDSTAGGDSQGTTSVQWSGSEGDGALRRRIYEAAAGGPHGTTMDAIERLTSELSKHTCMNGTVRDISVAKALHTLGITGVMEGHSVLPKEESKPRDAAIALLSGKPRARGGLHIFA